MPEPPVIALRALAVTVAIASNVLAQVLSAITDDYGPRPQGLGWAIVFVAVAAGLRRLRHHRLADRRAVPSRAGSWWERRSSGRPAPGIRWSGTTGGCGRWWRA